MEFESVSRCRWSFSPFPFLSVPFRLLPLPILLSPAILALPFLSLSPPLYTPLPFFPNPGICGSLPPKCIQEVWESTVSSPAGLGVAWLPNAFWYIFSMKLNISRVQTVIKKLTSVTVDMFVNSSVIRAAINRPGGQADPFKGFFPRTTWVSWHQIDQKG